MSQAAMDASAFTEMKELMGDTFKDILSLCIETLPDQLNAIEQDVRSNVLRCAPGANAITKNIVLATERLGRNEMLQLAAEGFADCMLGDEGREGVTSFVEKRKPNWSPE